MIQTLHCLRALRRIRRLLLERSLDDTTSRKESTSMTLPTLHPRNTCQPVDAMPEDPTPDEIERACQQIRATWSEQERRYRQWVLRPTELDEARARRVAARAGAKTRSPQPPPVRR